MAGHEHWTYVETDDCFTGCWRIVQVDDDNEVDQCEVAGQVWREDDARLMAAAPALLDACEAALDILDHHGSRIFGSTLLPDEPRIYGQLREALAVARREGG